ncbi:MAG: MFS family permease, partial [Natronomonas sp.]
VAFSIFYFFVGGLTNFFPTLLVAGGFSETVAGASFALLFAAGIFAKPIAGDLSDRFPRLLVAISGLLVALVGTVLVLIAPSLPVIAVGTVLTALGYKSGFPIADTVVMEAAPDGSMGSDVGASRAAFLTANAVGPGFVGIVAEVTDFTTAFWLLGACLLGSVFLLVRQYRRHSR